MLKFVKFEESHIPYYYTWRNDPEVAKYDQVEFLRPRAYSEIEAWSMRMVEGYTYLILDQDKPIGTCAIMHPDMRNRHAELSIVIGDRAYWSKGFGTLIMKQLLQWGFEGLNLERLYLHVFAFNTRAIGLYEKMGFTKEGTLRNMVYRDGQYHDVYAYGLLREEWMRSR
jgi:RimJ/RimL family protein N-acetyltransferase